MDANRCFVKPDLQHMLPWYRPECRGVTHVSTEWGGLCDACYQRANRWARKRRETAA